MSVTRRRRRQILTTRRVPPTTQMLQLSLRYQQTPQTQLAPILRLVLQIPPQHSHRRPVLQVPPPPSPPSWDASGLPSVPTDTPDFVADARAKALFIPHPVYPGLDVILLPDPTHLMKNVRNAWWSSRKGGTRKMVYTVWEDGKYQEYDVSWDVLVGAYNYSKDHHASTRPSGLTHTSINLDNFTKMNVKPVDVVFNSRTAQLISNVWKEDKAAIGQDPQGTLLFLRDCMTFWTSLSAAKGAYKYKSTNDRRLGLMVGALQLWERQAAHNKAQALAAQAAASASVPGTTAGAGDTSASTVKSHVPKVTLEALSACVYGLITLIDQHTRRVSGSGDGPALGVGGLPTFPMPVPCTDKCENWFGFLRTHSAEDNPSCWNVLTMTNNGTNQTVYRSQLHRQSNLKCQDGTEDVVMPATAIRTGKASLKRPRHGAAADGDGHHGYDAFVYSDHWPVGADPGVQAELEAAVGTGPLSVASRTFSSLAQSVVAHVVVHLSTVTGRWGDDLTRYFTSVTEHVPALVEEVSELVSFRLTKGGGTVALVPGKKAWRNQVHKSFLRALGPLQSPEARCSLWDRVTGMDTDIGDAVALQVTALVLNETLRAVVPVKVAQAVTGIGADAAATAARVADVVGVRAAPAVPAAPGPGHGDELETLFDLIQTEQLWYLAGWLAKRLRDLKHIMTDSKDNAAALTFIQNMDVGLGAYIAPRMRMGPQQRLTVCEEPVVEFLLRLEHFISSKVLCPAQLHAHKPDLPKWAMFVLSRSEHVRALWAPVVECVGRGTPVKPAVAVAVLERFVRQYLKSRCKTLRLVAGAVAESSAVTAIRKKLKASQAGTTPSMNALTYVLREMHGSDGSEAVALMDRSHGVVFEHLTCPTHGQIISVKEVGVGAPNSRYGEIAVDARVLEVLRPVRKPNGRPLKMVTADLVEKCDTIFYPLNVKLGRPCCAGPPETVVP